MKKRSQTIGMLASVGFFVAVSPAAAIHTENPNPTTKANSVDLAQHDSVFDRVHERYQRLREQWEREDREQMERDANRAERPFGDPERYEGRQDERLPDRGEIIRDRMDRAPRLRD